MTNESLLAVFLIEKIGELAFEWSAEKIGNWWKNTSVDNAISQAAAQFNVYPGLDSTLRQWSQSPETATILRACSEGNLQRAVTADALSSALENAGFVALPDGPSADTILRDFFQHYLQELLKSEGTVVATNVLLQAIETSTQKQADQVVDRVAEMFQRTLGQQPPAQLGVSLGLSLGDARQTTEVSGTIRTVGTLLEEGRVKAAFDLIEIHANKLGSKATTHDQYEILANRARALSQLNEFEKAEIDFRDALKLKPERANALANVGLIRLLRGDATEALSFSERAIEKDANNPSGLKVKAQALAQLGRIVEARAVADQLQVIADRKHLLGVIELWAGNWSASSKNLEEAFSLTPANPSIRAILAHALLAGIQDTLQEKGHIPFSLLPEELLPDINKASLLLNEAIDQLRKRNDPSVFALALIDRATVQALLGQDGADDDCIEALDIGITVVQLFQQAIAHLFSVGKNGKALEYLEKFRKGQEKNAEIELLYAHALLATGNAKEALRLLDDPGLAKEPFRHAATLAKLDCHIQLKEFAKAEEIFATLSPEDRNNWELAIREAYLLSQQGKRETAVILLREILEKAPPQIHWRLKLSLAEHLAHLEQWAEAANLFETVLSTKSPKGFLRIYLACLHNADRIPQCLQLAKDIRMERGIIPEITEVEADTLANLGNLKEADELYAALAKTQPDYAKWKLHRAGLALRRGDRESALKLLPSPVEAVELGWEDSIDSAKIRSFTGDHLGALETAYRTVRKNPSIPAVYVAYFGLCIRVDPNFDEQLYPNKVGPGSWVSLRIDGATQVHEILEIGEAPTAPYHHLPTDEFAKSVAGKSVGDEVLLVDTPITRQVATIVEIRSKYVGMLHNIQNDFNTSFPKQTSLMGFRYKTTKEFLAPLKEILAERARHLSGSIEQYAKLHIPISTLAKMLQRSDLDTWEILISGGLGQSLYAANGTPQAQQEYAQVAAGITPIVLELTSIYALKKLGILESLVKLERPLHIPQSILDGIDEIISVRQFESKSPGLMTIWEQNGQLFRREITKEEIQQALDDLTQISSWLREHCKVMGVEAVEGTKKLVQELLSQPARDSILLAKQLGGVLLSEDLRLRDFALSRFGVKGAASFHFIGALVRKQVITAEKYNEILAQLLYWKYEFVPITEQTLQVAFQLDMMTPGQYFRAAIDQLALPSVLEDPVINIIANFFRELSFTFITSSRKQAAMHLALDAVAKRGWTQLEPLLIQRIRQRLYLHPLGFQEIMREIRAWKRARLLP